MGTRLSSELGEDEVAPPPQLCHCLVQVGSLTAISSTAIRAIGQPFHHFLHLKNYLMCILQVLEDLLVPLDLRVPRVRPDRRATEVTMESMARKETVVTAAATVYQEILDRRESLVSKDESAKRERLEILDRRELVEILVRKYSTYLLLIHYTGH